VVTHTAQGIPGDPINVGPVGTKDDILSAMHAGAWCITPKQRGERRHQCLQCARCQNLVSYDLAVARDRIGHRMDGGI
jgi:LssY C-terminus